MTESDITLCGHGSGTPSTKNMKAYLTTRYASVAKNGVRKGVVAVRRPKKMTDSLRKKFHDTYKIILGRNIYSQAKRQYVYNSYNGKYYSDCSSSGCATYNKIGIKMDLLNTAGIYKSSLFENVPVTIKNGHITNPEILKVGDALLFAGEDASRPKQIGHVEFVYEIKEQLINYKVICSALTVRKSATTLSKALGYVHNKDVVAVSKTSGTWGYAPSLGGWISIKDKYVKRM